MYKRQPIARWLPRAAFVTSVAWGAFAWAQSGNQTSPPPQPQPSKPAAAPAPGDLEPLGGSQRSAQQVGSRVPVESVEPGVNTSAIQPSSPEAPSAQSKEQAVAPSAAKPAQASTASASAPKSGAPASKPGAAAGKAHDTIQLDTTQITGNRELPKVLYIVPWKRSDLGDLTGKPVNSLVDEVLAPVDRDVFKRQNRYYDALKPDAPKEQPAAGAAARP
jgi:hypothetical protein